MPLLILLFIALPILEIWVIIQVGQEIGALPTIALLFLDGFVGAALARSQGRAVWRRFNEALAEGRMPGREVFDGAAVIVGGTLMLTPGFVTDVFAFALLVPPTRALVRRLAGRYFKRVGGPAVSGAAWTYRRVGPRPRPGPGQRGPGGRASSGGGASAGGRGYDVEGSARELGEEERALGHGGDDG